ncbi:putative peptide transporter [Thozetella sp. PMI_491]|nr:putative peptide transporter [Thozetella sp. PMI_491]
MATLRRVPGALPRMAFFLCAVEFCERASYYGCASIWTNYINRGLPVGGNGWGAVDPSLTTQTQGALGMGQHVANAVSQSFTMLAYTLPLFSGYLADAKFGRYPMIFWGVIVCGVAHVLIILGGIPSLIENGNAKIPFFLGVYILSIGAAMFKPNVSPLLLDQITTKLPKVITLKSGERVIEDPESTAEKTMLWFYLLINIGAFMSVATSYSARFVGWWLAFLLPLILYLPLPILLIWLKPRLIMHEPRGSDLPNVFRVISYNMSGGGLLRVGTKGWWDPAKPSYQEEKGLPVERRWNDQFVEDVKRALQASAMFMLFPVQYWNDNGIGSSANFQGSMLIANNVPNDVIGNFNSLSIIVFGPILNYGLYPFLRKNKIHYGPVARITTGLAMATLGGIAFTVLQYYAYQQSPCGYYGSSDPTCTDTGIVAPVSLWIQGIPLSLGGISELFINVPAYGIAYSRAPINMRGVVSAINLFNTGIANAVNLACSAVIGDPNLIWDFGGPAIVGVVVTIFFYFNFRHIDREEYVLSTNETSDMTGTRDFIQENEISTTVNRPPSIAENDATGISQKI